MAQTVSQATFWTVDPSSGDYVLGPDGLPVLTSSLTHRAFYRLKVPRKNWMYAPDENYGSDYAAFNGKQSSSNTSVLETIGQRALQPIIDDGSATAILVQASDRSMNATQLQTKITPTGGDVETFAFDPIGNT